MKKFNIKSMKTTRLKTTKGLIEIDPRDFLNEQSKVAKALSEAIIDGDKEAFQEIVGGYISIMSKEELSRISKLPIATIRRVAAGSNYNIETLLKITAALNKAA